MSPRSETASPDLTAPSAVISPVAVPLTAPPSVTGRTARGRGWWPPIPVKILVSGGFGVGKTTMIGAISEIDPLTTEAAMTTIGVGVDLAGAAGDVKTTTTVAMDFGRVTIDDSIILYLFGTPGQDRFGFMWNDLAQGALGGVVLVDTSRLADCYVALDYFEKIGLPFVVAVNQFEGRGNLSLEQVRDTTDVDLHVPVVAVDARVRESVKQAVLCLLNVVLTRARSAVAPGSCRSGSDFVAPPSGV